MARKQVARFVLSALALALPFVLVAKAQRAVAESAVGGVVQALLRVTAPLAPAAPAPATVAPVAQGADLRFDLAVDGEGLAAKAPMRRGQKSGAAAPTKLPALFVSAASVLSLSKSAARPQGTFVAQTAEHPAGLQLVGVAGLGIGVQDGDILVDAMGMTPRSSGEIIGAIIQARAARARFLSGKLWRRGQTFGITVEQPYLDPA